MENFTANEMRKNYYNYQDVIDWIDNTLAPLVRDVSKESMGIRFDYNFNNSATLYYGGKIVFDKSKAFYTTLVKVLEERGFSVIREPKWNDTNNGIVRIRWW